MITQYFSENGKPSDRSTIDGVTVTPENEADLKQRSLRIKALAILEQAIVDTSFLWGGVQPFPERDRIVGILEAAREQIIQRATQ